MSIFKSILSRVFRGSTLGPGTAQAAEPSSTTAAAEAPAPTPVGLPAGVAPEPTAAAAPVDVAAVMEGLAAQATQQLDWRHSIVDLMKLLDLDSSLGARKELAQELGYTGALDGSAAMNTWLHRAVMRRLAENGGQVPADLRD